MNLVYDLTYIVADFYLWAMLCGQLDWVEIEYSKYSVLLCEYSTNKQRQITTIKIWLITWRCSHTYNVITIRRVEKAQLHKLIIPVGGTHWKIFNPDLTGHQHEAGYCEFGPIWFELTVPSSAMMARTTSPNSESQYGWFTGAPRPSANYLCWQRHSLGSRSGCPRYL